MDYNFNNFDNNGFSFLEEKLRRDREEKLKQEQSNLSKKPAVPDKPDIPISELKAAMNKSTGGSSGSTKNNSSENVNASESASAVTNTQTVAEHTSLNAVAEPAPIDVVAETPIKNRPKLNNPKSKSNSKPNNKSTNIAVEYAKNIPIDVMNAMRRLFPQDKLSCADLISAFVYIHTNGGCEISERAKAAVKQYKGDKSDFDIAVKISDIERVLKEVLVIGKSMELGTAFMINDRLFSVKRGANAKDQNLRDSGTLNMLENIRKSGKEQAELDARSKGREIYEAVSVNNDYNNKKGNNTQ